MARLVGPCASELDQIPRTSSVDVGGLEASAAVPDLEAIFPRLLEMYSQLIMHYTSPVF